MRVKIRVHQDLVPSNNKSYPGGAQDVLLRMGAANLSIRYTDHMPIYCDLGDDLYAELKRSDWIRSIEVVPDGAV